MQIKVVVPWVIAALLLGAVVGWYRRQPAPESATEAAPASTQAVSAPVRAPQPETAPPAPVARQPMPDLDEPPSDACDGSVRTCAEAKRRGGLAMQEGFDTGCVDRSGNASSRAECAATHIAIMNCAQAIQRLCAP